MSTNYVCIMMLQTTNDVNQQFRLSEATPGFNILRKCKVDKENPFFQSKDTQRIKNVER